MSCARQAGGESAPRASVPVNRILYRYFLPAAYRSTARMLTYCAGCQVRPVRRKFRRGHDAQSANSAYKILIAIQFAASVPFPPPKFMRLISRPTDIFSKSGLDPYALQPTPSITNIYPPSLYMQSPPLISTGEFSICARSERQVSLTH